MITFAWPWMLLLLPIVILPWMRKKQQIPVSSINLFEIGDSWRLKLTFLVPLSGSLGLLFLILGLARLQKIDEVQHIEKEGLDIMLVIDTSGSMEEKDYAWEGVRSSRMEVAKKTLWAFIQSRPNDRLGMVVFGEEAFTQAPLSTDHSGLKPFVEQIQIGLAGAGGTAIGDGMAIAAQRLKQLDAPSKIMIVLTDGAANRGHDPKEIAYACAQLGIRVYPIAMGGGAENLMHILGMREDVDDSSLAGIAQITKGKAFAAQSAQELSQVYAEIDRLEPTTAEILQYTLRKELYKPFIFLATLCFFIEFLLSQTILRRLP